MFAPVAATVDPDALSGCHGEFLDHGGGDCLLPHGLGHRLGAVSVGAGLIADALQAGDALLQRRVAQVSYAGLDRVIEPETSLTPFFASLRT